MALPKWFYEPALFTELDMKDSITEYLLDLITEHQMMLKDIKYIRISERAYLALVEEQMMGMSPHPEAYHPQKKLGDFGGYPLVGEHFREDDPVYGTFNWGEIKVYGRSVCQSMTITALNAET